jgi:putative aldouronate transport system permease protein
MARKRSSELPLHLMILPSLILLLIFSYGPMVGIIIAFQRFIPALGLFGPQEWVGLENYRYLLSLPNTLNVLRNTVYIAFLKTVLNLIVPITFSLLLNEVKNNHVKKIIQTSVYLPHFLSWVILGGVIIDILSPSHGIINKIIKLFGAEPIFFLGENKWFPITLVLTDVWKEFGFATVIYLASITSIDMQLYEAAIIDGANRFRQTWHITLPGMRMIIVLMMVLSLGNILNAGFDQVFNLYSPQVYESGDIIDTFVYRIGLVNAQFGVATAVGLFKSVISFVFISVSYYLAYKFADYRIF